MTRDELKQVVIAAARKYGINEAIALAQIQAESNFNPSICSNKGACGIAQFMPATAKQYGLINRKDALQSMEAWGKHMTYLLRKYNGDYPLALAAYNAGEGNVAKYKGIPPFRETKNYVAKILTAANISPVEPVSNEPPAGNEPPPGDKPQPKPFDWKTVKPEYIFGGIILLVILARK